MCRECSCLNIRYAYVCSFSRAKISRRYLDMNSRNLTPCCRGHFTSYNRSFSEASDRDCSNVRSLYYKSTRWERAQDFSDFYTIKVRLVYEWTLDRSEFLLPAGSLVADGEGKIWWGSDKWSRYTIEQLISGWLRVFNEFGAKIAHSTQAWEVRVSAHTKLIFSNSALFSTLLILFGNVNALSGYPLPFFSCFLRS